MNFTDATSLYEGDPARVALLSTFQFDPDFFERRLLRASVLARARRIIVFMDERQWRLLAQSDVAARSLNRRYLVVPVPRSIGVFHPKLSLMLGEAWGRVICGSNNLTRSGYGSNLELLNCIPFFFETAASFELNLARQAYGLFTKATDDVDPSVARLAKEWLDEAAEEYPWLKKPEGGAGDPIELLHSYEGAIWDRLVAHLDSVAPDEFFVISPFHDQDGKVFREMAMRWPKATFRFLVQQRYTGFPVDALRESPNISLLGFQDHSRRLHAKLIAWRSPLGTGCLVGSANFTSAGLRNRNVEACLLVRDVADFFGALFDDELQISPIAWDDFEPGPSDSEEGEGKFDRPILVRSAVYDGAGSLTVSYRHQFEVEPRAIRLTLRVAGEAKPRFQSAVPSRRESTATITIDNASVVDGHGTLLASLVAECGDASWESAPVWVIQEHRLTFDPSAHAGTKESKIAETGAGLAEFIDELGQREGIAGVVAYLQHLNIRFVGGERAGWSGAKRFKLRMHDPYRSDRAPDWLIKATNEQPDLEFALYDFADRHETRRLSRHANAGNINGFENFLDILVTLTRVLFIYRERGVIPWAKVQARLLRYVQIATGGSLSESEDFNGLLNTAIQNLDGDVELLREVCQETRFLAEVRAVLWLAQYMRLIGSGMGQRVSGMLPSHVRAFDEVLASLKLEPPTPADVLAAVQRYDMMSEATLKQLWEAKEAAVA